MWNVPAARLQRRPSFISDLCCCYQRLSVLRGTTRRRRNSLGNSGLGWGDIRGHRGSTYAVQTAYSPQFEDRLFHVLLPFASYATLVGSAYAARSNVGGALFGVGAAALLLLFIGIHNAWDAVTSHVFVKRREQPKAERRH